MGRKPRALVDLVEKTLHRILNRADGNALAAAAQEKSGPIAGLTDRAQQLVALRLVVPQRQLRVIAERNDALLPSLPTHLHLLREQIDVHPIDSAQLRQAHAC